MSSFENISKRYAFGENDRHTIFVDACERGSHSGIPAYAPVVLLKQNLRKLNAQSRTRVSLCYAASRTRQAVLVYGRNFAVSIILFIFKTRHSLIHETVGKFRVLQNSKLNILGYSLIRETVGIVLD